MAFKIKQTLGTVQNMQTKFERKGKVVDAEMRSAFPLPPPLAELNDEQKLVVESCRYLESEEGGEWEPLPSSSPFVDMWIKHAPAKKGERSIALGKATAGESSVQSADFVPSRSLPFVHTYVAVLDLSTRDALASWCSVVSRKNMRSSSEQKHPARLVQRRTGSNDAVIATIKKMPFPLRNREFVNRQVCCSDVNGDLLYSLVPADEVIDYGIKIITGQKPHAAHPLWRLAMQGHVPCVSRRWRSHSDVCREREAAPRARLTWWSARGVPARRRD